MYFNPFMLAYNEISLIWFHIELVPAQNGAKKVHTSTEIIDLK